MTIIHQEALQDRARELEDKGFNGLKLVLVRLPSGPHPAEAYLEVHFHNSLGVTDIRNTLAANPALGKSTFPISGGSRILGGPGSEEIKVAGVTGNFGDDYMELVVAPVGDYSTYHLSLETADVPFKQIDPLFSELPFKFRPGCFSIECAPEWEPAAKPKSNPLIDYLAKDYESFRHTMIAAMMQRVPDWQATSEADQDMVLLETLSAAADELSDYQDRVMNEAYLTSARQRVSLARHARLMDYHIHQGNQASTVLALELLGAQAFVGPLFPAGFKVWTGYETPDAQSRIFITKQEACLHWLLNSMELYTWSGSQPALAAGSTSADLKLAQSGEDAAITVRDLIQNGLITRLLIQEWKNPDTGQEAGRDPQKRQIITLLAGTAGAEVVHDPVEDEWMVRVHWEEQDKLVRPCCFTTQCPDGEVDGVSAFHGNLVDVFHGQLQTLKFKAPDSILSGDDEAYFEPNDRWGALCRLKTYEPLAYTLTPLGNEVPPKSTLSVSVTSGGNTEIWEENISLIHSRENDPHFIVETDELGQSRIRFGNGVNGQTLPGDAEVVCTFQVGRGTHGNIGADKLVNFDSTGKPEFAAIQKCWNPLDADNGRDPEPVAEIIRRVQEAYRQRQLRAVTEEDYVARAEELPEVSRATARYMWTGSWRTVRVSIDPKGTTTLEEETRGKIARHLEAVRLIGEDIEIRPPRYVPIIINVSLCVHPDYWAEDIRFLLEQEFSDGYTPDGRMGFFHPDAWAFGQKLYASQIVGRIQAVQGVDHVVLLEMWRWNEGTPGSPDSGIIEVQENEIILVKNDPDHMEKGKITFDVQGGRW